MRREVSVGRLARSAGLDADDVLLALIDRGVEIDDPDQPVSGPEWKAARAAIREMRGGPRVIRQKTPPAAEAPSINPQIRSAMLHCTLSVDEVRMIHERLCEDFAQTSDPIDPPGVRSESLLESAVNRQTSGFEDRLKYHEPVVNAATLLYGICNDHPFHNGNKRTALVATLAHLDRNNLVLKDTKQREIFALMIAVADHKLLTNQIKIGRDTHAVPRRGTADEEVLALRDWLTPRVDKITRGEIRITYRELRKILARFGYTIRPGKSTKVSICRATNPRPSLFGKQKIKAVMSIDWHDDGREIAIGTVKHIRETLRLCERDGVTRETFYGGGLRVDRFINEYRIVLRKLANR